MRFLQVNIFQVAAGVSISRGPADGRANAATDTIKLKSIPFILTLLAEGSCEIRTEGVEAMLDMLLCLW